MNEIILELCGNRHFHGSLAKALTFMLVVLSHDAFPDVVTAHAFRKHSELANLWLIDRMERTGDVAPYWYDPENRANLNPHPMGLLIQARWTADLSTERKKLLTIHQKQISSIAAQYRLDFSEQGRPPEIAGVASGEVALILSTLLASPHREEYEIFLQQFPSIVEFGIDPTLGIQQTFGSWAIQSDVEQRLYAGQMALSLLELYEVTGQNAALTLAGHLIGWLNSKAEPIKKLALHPTAIPWYAQALRKRAELLKDPEDWIQLRTIALSLLELQDKKVFPGRFWRPKAHELGPPNTVRDAQSTRTLMMGLEASLRLSDQRSARRLKKAILLGLENLKAHQYTMGVAEAFRRPNEAIGAVRFRYDESLCRIDSTIFAAEVFEQAARLALAQSL